jgi:hypothetical protein
MISNPRCNKPDEIAYCTIRQGENPPSQNGCRLKSGYFLKALVSHPPLSQFNRTFTKPTGLHYIKYRFSPDIATNHMDMAFKLTLL